VQEQTGGDTVVCVKEKVRRKHSISLCAEADRREHRSLC